MPTKKVTPDHDMELNSFEFDGQVFYVRKKFKVGRFLKNLTKDPASSVEIALTEDSYERFLDLEMDLDNDFAAFLEGLSNALSGKSLGN